jgi:hypothetical protein
MREISKPESDLCTRLRPILAALPPHATIAESADFYDVLTALAWFLPDVLAEIHPEWKGMTLDGIYPAVARKTGDNEIDIFGRCIFLGDQTLTPLHVKLQLASAGDAITWLDCRVGESDGHGMLRVPYSRGIAYGDKLYRLKRPESIEWVYHVGYGERRE